MSLDSLLASLKTAVQAVTAVQPAPVLDSGCYGNQSAAVQAVTPPEGRAGFVTAVTADVTQPYKPKPAPIGACTAVTAVTAEIIKCDNATGEVAANDAPAPQHHDPEAWLERAAIAEYDGGQTRQDAEAVADACCWPHSDAMNGAEIDTFAARLARFTDKGLGLTEAEATADRLVTRDREGDDRRLCLECAHLRPGARCGNWAEAGMDEKLPSDFTTMLQRCDGFAGAGQGCADHRDGGRHE